MLTVALLFFAVLLSGCDVREEKLYGEAKAYMAAKDYSSALVLLSVLSDYRDSDTLMAQCREAERQAQQTAAYEKGRELEEAGDPAAAAEQYAQVGDYMDAQQRAADCTAENYAITVDDAVASIKTFVTAEDWDAGLDAVVDALDACEGDDKAQYLADALRLLAAGNGPDAALKIAAAREQGCAALCDEEWTAALQSLLAVRLDDESAALSIAAALWRFTPQIAASEAESAKVLHVSGATRHTDRNTEAVGKVLIYGTRRNYIGGDEAYLDLTRMRMLPDELLPASVDEASYAIEIHYDYKHVQKFTTYYNWGVREYAEITVYNLKTGRTEGETVTVLAPSAKSLSTAKMVSEFVSGGPPDEEKINEALAGAIESLAKKLASS